MDVKIIYEDEDLAVINKPAGVVVNRSDTASVEATLQDWAESKFKIQSSKLRIGDAAEEEFLSRGGIVHRLDKETSGIILVAKNASSFQALKNQFKERKVEKTYIALVHGKVAPQEGTINVPVGRLPWNRKRFGVVAGGREAETKYKVLSIKYYVSDKNREPLSLLELYPKTGRTHQIRVHLKYMNFPIFSDPLYGGRKVLKQDRKILPRIFLHAAKISFTHPVTSKKMEFEAEVPFELSEFLKTLSS